MTVNFGIIEGKLSTNEIVKKWFGDLDSLKSIAIFFNYITPNCVTRIIRNILREHNDAAHSSNPSLSC